MFRDRDFDPRAPLPPQAPLLIKDLELEVLFAAMAAGDAFVLEVVKRALLIGLDMPAAIGYRQAVMSDCFEHAHLVRQVYALALEALERERKIWGWNTLRSSPEGTLYRSREVLGIFFDILKRLRRLAEEHAAAFRSEGFSTLFRLLVTELNDDFLAEVEDHLQRLSFRQRLVMSARLGAANEGVHYVLRRPPERRRWWERFQEWRAGNVRRESPSYTYEIPERDENGARALGELRGRGVARVAEALGQSTDHLLAFFGMLRTELAFFIGALNLRDCLRAKGQCFCLPEPLPLGVTGLSARNLCDVSLTLSVHESVVGNALAADDKFLIVITGANRGGKSTFLRSVGQAQVMMQCGLFVCAEAYRANVCAGVFTHYKREEDASMTSGKLDQELARMSCIVDLVARGSLLLCNESFGSTNEREGSQIARQIVTALVEREIKVLYVTHMYELAYGFWEKEMPKSLFLRAQRLPDGTRTYRMEEGQPLETSYGVDLYRRIFEGGTKPAATEDATLRGAALP
jgi:MutS domain V